MNYNQFEVESRFDGKLKIAYLNHPETYNALNRMTLKELREFMEECDDDPKVRCIAIGGKGKAFCSGQNLKSVTEMNFDSNDKVIRRIVMEDYNPLVLSIIKNKKPVISLVNGAAVGSGAMLALICDFTLAMESAYFSQAFGNIGLIPDTGGTYFLPKLLGRQMANYLTFTGKKISATEAKQLGLIAEVFADDEFEAKSNEILEFMSNHATMAIGLTKRAFLYSYSNTLQDQLEMEGTFQQKAAFSKDFHEGITAFMEKRKPKYKGK
ncbi:MAG: enoyl-CoA hydratase/isomerase family protein [Flavobacteriaceae bacterium]|jgi:2-(1,2-epoxy-1,2-dihydrophenyl)acetyl-CoA isomerase|nr:enoyl-CoA hydratase/isomerase family protein [Flavobacteriaceae bacterium]